MSLVDKPFKDALKNLPLKKLSWQADRRIRKQLKTRARELDGHKPFWLMFRRFIAAPVALALLLTSTGGYAYYSPSVIQTDLLYPVKSELESVFYPEDGTSEDRVAYHLWLSDRRYAEVQEILKRREGGQQTAAVAYAQDGSGDLLDDILAQTLERATQHVEYAFLVTKEIREVERVEQVKEQIKETLEKQKEVIVEVAPVLKEVKLTEKKVSRKKTIVREAVVSQPAVKAVEEPVEESKEPTDALDTAALEATAETDVSTEALEEPAVEVPVDEPLELVQIVEVEEVEELEDAEAFLEDRLAFQEELLASLEQEVQIAEAQGIEEVELVVSTELVEIVEEEVQEVEDQVIVTAFAVHLQVEQEILEQEIEELQEEILIAELPADPLEEAFVPLEDVLDALPDEGTEAVVAATELGEEAVDPQDLPETETTIAAEEEVETSTEPSDGTEEILIALEELPVADEPGSDVMILPEEVALEGEEPAVASIPVDELPEIPAATSELVDLPLVEDADVAPVETVEEAAVTADVPRDEGNDAIDVEAELQAYCVFVVRQLCDAFDEAGCRTRLKDRCAELNSVPQVDQMIEQARKRLQDRAQEQEVLDRMQEKQERLEQIDESLDRMEEGDLLNTAPIQRAPAQIIPERSRNQ